MSKELIQKVIEAGIVPRQAIKQLKAWRQLPEDITEDERQRATQQQLISFVHEIGDLLDEDKELPELRETMLDLDARFKNKGCDCAVVINIPVQNLVINTRVLVDGAFFIFQADKYGDVVAAVGNQVSVGDGKVYEIWEGTPLYKGEHIAFYRCHMQEVPYCAQMPELRQFG